MTEAPLWSAAEAAAATAGDPRGDWHATGVSIDSRSVQPGDLFLALKGPNFDGHAFVAEALKKGAAAAVVAQQPVGVTADAPLLFVEDTMAALEDLGRRARARCRAKVVAITGSVGKTGTKEALRLALAAQGKTAATQGNLNNHWGVPLSLARLAADTDYAVFELGMTHAGEISPLSRMVQPHVGVITTVERVHIENFESIEGIAAAKSEIFDGMGPDGIAVLNRDNPLFAQCLAAARTQGIATQWSFGRSQKADARLLDASLRADSSTVDAQLFDRKLRYTLPVPGAHWVMNSLAVLLAVAGTGADIDMACEALRRLSLPKGRGAQERLSFGDGCITLIDESYNASPVAMRAAFAVAASAPVEGQRIAVLGDMLELGAEAPAAHAGLADAIIEAGFDAVFTCGPLMRRLYEALPPGMAGGHAADSAALTPMVTGALRAGDLVMIKGSAGSRMAKVVDAIRAMAQQSARPRTVNSDSDPGQGGGYAV